LNGWPPFADGAACVQAIVDFSPPQSITWQKRPARSVAGRIATAARSAHEREEVTMTQPITLGVSYKNVRTGAEYSEVGSRQTRAERDGNDEKSAPLRAFAPSSAELTHTKRFEPQASRRRYSLASRTRLGDRLVNPRSL
jgi:hypothetical protein